MTRRSFALILGTLACATARTPPPSAPASASPATAADSATSAPGLWSVYDGVLSHAKHIDLTHAISPHTPIWKGFGAARFAPTVDPATGKAYTYAADGFESNQYHLTTDQYGTQLDPPAHWAPEYPAIDELPPTFAVRPLVVISIVEQAQRQPTYHLQVADIERWESQHGRVPPGSVVMVRSDWSKKWPAPELAESEEFPGVSLEALRFLHEQRHILFHGHEPLDTDTTEAMEGEGWLMHHGYTQAEGVANLDQVAETGCLVAIGYPKLEGGLGGFARFIALCPADWKYGVAVGDVPDAPLPKNPKPLRWDPALGIRTRN
ncbi:MAG TPA: cyclase family protein [Polyangiaceae bacterium]|nr:cyclase family protein [Polyangiaceae bacterium]